MRREPKNTCPEIDGYIEALRDMQDGKTSPYDVVEAAVEFLKECRSANSEIRDWEERLRMSWRKLRRR